MKNYEDAVSQLKEILKDFTDDYAHLHNVELARITFPFNTISITSKAEMWKMLNHNSYAKDRYMISSWGRVFDEKNSKYISAYVGDTGYLKVGIAKDTNSYTQYKMTTVSVHTLVASTFIDTDITDFPTVNHIDLNKTNNTLENLEWLSSKDNVTHARINGAFKNRNKKKYLTKEDIDIIRAKHKNGDSIVKISKEFNRSVTTISDIVNNKTYKDDFWENLGFPSK